MIALRILFISIFVVSSVLVGLGLGILVNKAVREARDAADRRRRQILEPRLLAAVHAEEREIEVPTLAAAGASRGSAGEAVTAAGEARVPHPSAGRARSQPRQHLTT